MLRREVLGMSLGSVREIKGEPVHNNEGEKEKKLLSRCGGANRWKVVVIQKGYKFRDQRAPASFGNGLLGSKLLKDRSQESSLVQIFVPPTIPGCISHARIRSSGPARCHALLIPLTLSMHRALTLTRIRLTSLPARPCRASHDSGRPNWPNHDLTLTRP